MTSPTYRQLDYWIRRGWLRVETPGSGRPRAWPATERRIAELMSQLVHAGIRVDRAASVARRAVERNAKRIELAPGLHLIVETPAAPARGTP